MLFLEKQKNFFSVCNYFSTSFKNNITPLFWPTVQMKSIFKPKFVFSNLGTNLFPLSSTAPVDNYIVWHENRGIILIVLSPAVCHRVPIHNASVHDDRLRFACWLDPQLYHYQKARLALPPLQNDRTRIHSVTSSNIIWKKPYLPVI